VLALDADAAGIRAGLKSAYMAIAAGFDVKVPTFPEGKDPADLGAENPELLKAAVRTSKTAVEFFLDALRPSAKDERSYQKLVEGSILPLIGAMESAIEREHFVRIVASRLAVSEDAVRREVAKRPAPQMAAAPSPELHQNEAESGLTPLEKKAGMLLARFSTQEGPHAGGGQEVLAHVAELFGPARWAGLQESIKPHLEELRFRFDAEVGEHSDEATIAADLLQDIEQSLGRERFKMKFL
jgi:DNA primase